MHTKYRDFSKMPDDKLRALANDLSRPKQWAYPRDIDQECIALCDALNNLPGISTTSSCCGHGKRPFRIFFVAKTIKSLLPIVLSADSSTWRVEVDNAIRTADMADIVIFMLEGPIGPPDIAGGANDFAESLRDNLH